MSRSLTYLISFVLVLSVATQVRADLPPGWSSQDVGGPAAAGSADYEDTTQTWTIRGDGGGIRGTTDQFHYVYKRLSGDGELAVRVASLAPAVDEWAMAGAMMRVFLDPGSPYVFMGVTPNGPSQDHGVTYYGRALPGASADHESSGEMTPPYWVKISRTGDVFAGYHSPDGRNWTEQYSDTAAGVPRDIYIGLAVTSNVGGALVTAVFDNGPTSACDPDPADGAQYVELPFLRWTAGVTAAFHDVYLGASPTLGPADHVACLPVLQTLYFHTPGLAPATTYYWRVDETGADGVSVYPGDVWSFTTAPATAYAPQPWDGGKGVEVEAELSWTGGAGAVSHKVYFGTDRAAVKAGDPSTVCGEQTTATYDPGTLDENTTYYWRVDERAQDDAVHQGDVWSFATLGPGDGVKAQYFEGTDLAGAPILTQMEDSIDHNWGGGEIAAGLNNSVSARWTADLEVPLTETYQLITTTDDGVRLWLDGRLLINDWTNHGSEDNTARVDLVAGQVYALTMEWYDDGGDAAAQLSWQSASIPRQIIPAGWLALPVKATGSRPVNAAVNVTQAPELRWTAGAGATGHDVYFGDDVEAVAGATTASTGIYRGRQPLDATSYDPGLLEWDRTYYWRIDEVNTIHPDSPWTGNVWSFTTADFVVVDDFESYSNDSPDRVFQTWVDGLGYSADEHFPNGHPGNNTGAGVGHDIWSDTSPHYEGLIIETDDVHGGLQAMPLYYDNTDLPYRSEAERTWATPQNWTLNGVDTPTLYVRGTAGNSPDPLYIVIEDSAGHVAVVDHPDATAATATEWTPWQISPSDLTNAGVIMTAVKKMCIGVGARNAAAPGGTGMILVDDVRVIKPVPDEVVGD